MADSDSRQSDPTVPSAASGPPRRGLGRGLGALIPGADVPAGPSGIVEIPVERIRPNAMQPRVDFEPEALAELAGSIREHGVLQPILVRPAPGGYEIVAGERRWRAAAAAGLAVVPAIVRRLDDRGALEAALVENLQREDLNPIERARAYRKLSEEFGLTQTEVATRVGRSQPSVANTMRLLHLPVEVQASLEAGRITEGHARALLTVEDHDGILRVWRVVEAKGLSVRETESAARRAGISRGIARRRQREAAGEINIIQQNLSESLGAPVRLEIRKGGRGEIRISFSSPEDLDRILGVLSGRGEGRP